MTEINPSKSLHELVSSYRLYRLRRITHECTSTETSRVKHFIKRVQVQLLRNPPNGEDPIQVLDFLGHTTRRASIQKMSEFQVFLTLSSLLEGFAPSQYVAIVGRTPSTEGRITYWPEAEQYLLANYEKPKIITKAVQGHPKTRQQSKRTRSSFPLGGMTLLAVVASYSFLKK